MLYGYVLFIKTNLSLHLVEKFNCDLISVRVFVVVTGAFLKLSIIVSIIFVLFKDGLAVAVTIFFIKQIFLWIIVNFPV